MASEPTRKAGNRKQSQRKPAVQPEGEIPAPRSAEETRGTSVPPASATSGASGRVVRAAEETALARPPAAPRRVFSPPRPGRDAVVTLQERLGALGALPSLQRPLTALDAAPSSATAAVDPEALPPPAPPPPPPAPTSFVDHGLPIPEDYGLDRLATLVRDPEWLFVYWELKGGNLERQRFMFSGEIMDQARWVLRVDAGPYWPPRFVDVDLRAGCWYLKVAPDSRYRLELGFFAPDGEFRVLCRGPEVVTPRRSCSPRVDEEWLVEREELRQLLLAGGAGEALLPSPAASERRLARSEHPRAALLFSGRPFPRE